MTPSKEQDPTASRTLILVNPVAGGGRGQEVRRQIEHLLTDLFPTQRARCDVALTQLGEVTNQARQACTEYGTIAAAGGDGTASAVLKGIFLEGRKTRFGLISLGTGNDLARSLGIYRPSLYRSKESLTRALQTLFAGEARPLDLCRIDGIGTFCNYAGIGLDARVLSDYTRFTRTGGFPLIRWSRNLKFAAYGILLAKHLHYRLPPGMTLTIGTGEREKQISLGPNARAVIVTNTRTYAGGFVLDRDSRPDDGLFEITCIRGMTDMLRILLARLSPFSTFPRPLPVERTPILEWTAPEGVPFEWDGESASAPLPRRGSISVAGQVEVLLPAQSP